MIEIVMPVIITTDKKKTHGERQVIFSSRTSLAVLNATAEGMGFTFMPCYLGDADNRLVRVGDPPEALTIELWILTHASCGTEQE